MSYELLLHLLEVEQEKFAKGKDVKHLTDRPEFKKIEQQDPSFAGKLKTAWEGDAKDWERTKGKNFEPLFSKMMTDRGLEKFAPKVQLSGKDITTLYQLFIMTFPSGNFQGADNSVWGNEKWAYRTRNESQEYIDLRILVEELEEEEAE